VAQGAYIIADFGKTLSKVTLWSKDGRMIDRFVRPTVQQITAEYRSLDIEDTRAWFIQTLARFESHPVEAIIPVAHGAAVVGLRGDRLAFPPPDY